MSRRRPAREDVGVTPAQPTLPAVAPAGDLPCPGPCNSAFRRAENQALVEVARAQSHHALHGDQPCDADCATDPRIINHDVPFHPGKPIWCVDVHAFNDRGEMLDHLAHHGCAERIVDQLGELPELALALAPGRLPTPSSGDIDAAANSGGGARALAHAPSLSPAWDTADLLIRWLVRVEDWLRARVGDEPAPTAYRTMTQAAAYLAARPGALLASEHAERIGRDVQRAHRRLEGLVGHDRLVHRLVEPCPNCGRKGLRRKDGDELVKCRTCGAVWDWDHFEWLARAYAQNERQRGTMGA